MEELTIKDWVTISRLYEALEKDNKRLRTSNRKLKGKCTSQRAFSMAYKDPPICNERAEKAEGQAQDLIIRVANLLRRLNSPSG